MPHLWCIACTPITGVIRGITACKARLESLGSCLQHMLLYSLTQLSPTGQDCCQGPSAWRARQAGLQCTEQKRPLIRALPTHSDIEIAAGSRKVAPLVHAILQGVAVPYLPDKCERPRRAFQAGLYDLALSHGRQHHLRKRCLLMSCRSSL